MSWDSSRDRRFPSLRRVEREGKSIPWWLIVLTVALYALAFQGSRPLFSPDEGRYTNVALNMIDDGDWMRPMLHPEVEHWAKPPLTYWSIAASINLLGRSEFAARLPSALAFAFTVLLLVRIGPRFVPDRPLLPSIVYATCAFPALASNLVTTDTLLTLWETLQALAFIELWSAADERARRNWRRLLWLAAALAFMTKGPPGLLVLAACAVFAGIRGRWRGVRSLFGWDALALFLVVGGAWYVVVAIREPAVWRYFLVEEVVNRVATDKMHRNGEWYGALKIYLPTLLLGALPWWPLAVPRVVSSFRRGEGPKSPDDASIFLRCWVIVPLVVFVLSRSRLPLYILPLFVPLAIVTARALSPFTLRSPAHKALLLFWCAIVLASRFVPSFVPLEDDDRVLADALRRVVPALPDEIAFVDAEPRFGLRFYLNSTIERLQLPDDEPNPRAQDIASEMREKEGCRLLLVPKARLDDFRSYLVGHAIAFKPLPDAQGFGVFAQSTADCAAYAQ